MTQTATIYDCEYLTNSGAIHRLWCGPHDPDPTVVQIGAVRVALTDGLPIEDRKNIYIVPKDRNGLRCELDPFFVDFTGITEQTIEQHGVHLKDALITLEVFSQGGKLWSWGHDDRNMMALSCFIEGIIPNIPANRFGNASPLLLKAGMPYEDILKTNSGRLASYFKLPEANTIKEHDGLNDALSITYAMQHLNRLSKLEPEWLAS